jgi:hypothetical protein
MTFFEDGEREFDACGTCPGSKLSVHPWMIDTRVADRGRRAPNWFICSRCRSRGRFTGLEMDRWRALMDLRVAERERSRGRK